MQNYSFRKYQFLSLRLWHWANSIVILGLLGTVLIRKTFLSWRTNAALIEEKMKAEGTPVTPELAKEIAVAIRNPLWDWHIYLGFVLGFLLLARILIAIIIEKKSPGFSAIKVAFGIKQVPKEERTRALHFTAVKAGYAIFYVVTLLMVITGFLLNFKAEIGLSRDLAATTKEIHEIMMWFFVFFVGGHIIGVVLAENRSDPGIVSDMIHGGKSEQNPRSE
ncbi:MAG: cytochrome b/b6 domain-containing protein [Polyangiaceae bacterium]|nr:cytochrome b/b6 domain-containing protein [Polyangiaceae bacterium]